MAQLTGGEGRGARPPARLELPPPVALAWFLARPTDVLDRGRRVSEDAFALRLTGLGDVVFLGSPDLVRAIFTADEEAARSGEANGFLRPIVGPASLLTLDGAPHRRHRKLLNPALHGERLASFAEVVRDVTERDLGAWRRGATLATRPRFQKMTLEIIVRAVFGIEAPGERAAWLERLEGLAELANHWLLLVPAGQLDLGAWSPWGKVTRMLVEADAAILAEIARRRRAAAEGRDMLALLLSARDEEGQGLSDAEIRDELVTMLLAGHETTATALSWAVDLLLRDPAALERARAEARAADGEVGAAFRPGGLAYLDAVCRETLRLRPVIGNVNRRIRRPLVIGDLALRAGQFASPCVWNLHHREDLYPEPERFRPERFLERTFTGYEWIPFGGGARRCIGMAFALAEMKSILATLLVRLELRPASPRPERVARRGITLAPARGGEVVVTARGG